MKPTPFVTPIDLVLPVAAGTRLLHIGPHKTGTTSLQRSISANREALLQQGVYCGAPAGQRSSNRAARALLRRPFEDPDRIVDIQEWEELVARVRASTTPLSVISGEEFSFCDTKEIQTILKSLGRERVHVAVTVRPLAKVLPSQWQLDLGRSTSSSFNEWLEWILRPRGARRLAQMLDIPHPFWFRHRHDQLAKRWADEIGADKVSVVVADGQRHRDLLSFFERLLGLTEQSLSTVSDQSNSSLSEQEIAIILRLHQLLEERGLMFATAFRSQKLKRRLLKVRARLNTDQKMSLPAWAVPNVRALSEQIYDGLTSSGIRIIGDPALLLQVPESSEALSINHEATEGFAQQLLSDLERDGKLRSESATPLLGKALHRILRRVKRLR